MFSTSNRTVIDRVNIFSYANFTKTNRFTRKKRFNRFTADQITNRFTANTATDI